MATESEWRREVAKAIVQLAQEVHHLNPGIACEYDLNVIAEAIIGWIREDEEGR